MTDELFFEGKKIKSIENKEIYNEESDYQSSLITFGKLPKLEKIFIVFDLKIYTTLNFQDAFLDNLNIVHLEKLNTDDLFFNTTFCSLRELVLKNIKCISLCITNLKYLEYLDLINVIADDIVIGTQMNSLTYFNFARDDDSEDYLLCPTFKGKVYRSLQEMTFIMVDTATLFIGEQFPNLENLNLTNCINFELSDITIDLESLTNLSLEQVSLDKESLLKVKLPVLVNLSINFCYITNFKSVYPLTNIRSLSLVGNRIKHLDLTHQDDTKAFSDLIYLNVLENSMESINSNPFNQLKFLDLRKNNFDLVDIKFSESQNKLKQLSFDKDQLFSSSILDVVDENTEINLQLNNVKEIRTN